VGAGLERPLISGFRRGEGSMSDPSTDQSARAGGARDGSSHRRARPVWTIGLAIGLIFGLMAMRSQPAVAGYGATVNSDGVNLRSDAGTWAAVVGTMWNGEWVEISLGPTEDGWYEVAAEGATGWVSGAFLTFDSGSVWSDPAVDPSSGALVDTGDEWTEAELDLVPDDGLVDDGVVNDDGSANDVGVGGVGGTAWVAIDFINVRAWAGVDADLIGTVDYGNSLTITGGEVNGFVPVSYGNGDGWVWGNYLSLNAAPGPEHWIDVDRSSQTITLFEGDQPIASYWGSMGFDESDEGFFATANGTYYVYEKFGGLSWTNWGRAWVRDWVAYDPLRLNGFHSFSLDSNGEMITGGDGPTGGCIALPPWAADAVYDHMRLGSRVEIHW